MTSPCQACLSNSVHPKAFRLEGLGFSQLEPARRKLAGFSSFSFNSVGFNQSRHLLPPPRRTHRNTVPPSEVITGRSISSLESSGAAGSLRSSGATRGAFANERRLCSDLLGLTGFTRWVQVL